jgi:O-antigen/teichoic acid export membrane protein
MTRELVRNISLSLLMNVSTRASNALMFVFISRGLGAQSAGTFQLALTYLLIFSVLTRGLDDHVVRQVAQSGREARRYFSSYAIVRFLASAALYGFLVVLVLYVLGYPDAVSLVILLVGGCVITDGLTSAANAVMLGLRKFGLPASVALGVCISRLLICGLLMLTVEVSIATVATIWLVSSVGAAILSLILVQRHLRLLPRWSIWDAELVKQQLSSVGPFVVNGFLMAIEFQVDVILLSMFHGEIEVGFYGAATTVVSTLAMMSQAYRFAIYPLMATYAAESQELLAALHAKSLLYLSALVVPMIFGIVLLAPSIVDLIFSSAFAESVVVLQILAASLFFSFLNVPSNRVMFACGRQRWTAWMVFGSMCVNLLLNAWLTPSHGAIGAALARVGSSLLFFVANLAVLERYVLRRSIQLPKVLWRPLLAASSMAVVVYVLQGIGLVWLPVIGAVTYLLILLIIGGIPIGDRRVLIGWLHRRFAVLD